MQAYLVEVLKANTWHRLGCVHFRYRDAIAAAKDRLTDGPMHRAVRVLPVNVVEQPVYSEERSEVSS